MPEKKRKTPSVDNALTHAANQVVHVAIVENIEQVIDFNDKVT